MHLESVAKSDLRYQRMRRKMVEAARRFSMQVPEYEIIMITLTYAEEDGWESSQISEYMAKLRRYYKYRLGRNARMRAMWSLEFTKAGRPHYHVLVWLPKRFKFPMPDKPYTVPFRRGTRTLPPMWPHGLTRIEKIRKRGAAGFYVSKYLSKTVLIDPKTKSVKSFRIFSISGLDFDTRCALHYIFMPKPLRDRVPLDQFNYRSYFRKNGAIYFGGIWYRSMRQLISFYGDHLTFAPRFLYPADDFNFFFPTAPAVFYNFTNFDYGN